MSAGANRNKRTPALPAGAPGKDGLLVLEFAPKDGAPGTGHGTAIGTDGDGEDAITTAISRPTEWTRRRHRTPLRVTRPLHPDPSLPGLPVVYSMCTGGGLVQGDRTRTDITVRAGSHALVTSQAATKIHSMTQGFAANDVSLVVESGATLEHLPDPTICFPRSTLHQTLTADVAPGGTLITADITVLGRLSDGDPLTHDHARLDTRITVDGRPALIDRTVLGGPGAFHPVMTGGAPVLGTFIAIAPDAATTRELAEAMRAAGGAGSDRPGVTILHRDAGVVARMLGHDAEAIQLAFHRLWDAARRHLLGVGAFDLRKR
ncbi:urease accessory protein UreD [Corynebacterium hansenii]|uniref:Urease accessory protein UreD n=1 Tax=Corynebacterium hansenii TaxID=394964 RepID=A0ABV7ZNE5_9CORY|nr:urease accessory protein UreD [Corynebacterium hansenii]WJZ00203.1 Urease accessory protein UreD [Corynebacterium hansenii]